MSKIRWGILGDARINQRLLPSFARAEHTELVAIASRSLEKARAAAQRDGIPQAYGSYDELLRDPSIQVIYNPLPNHLHAEWTMRAADHGKHILCEKPLAPTAAEAQRIVEHCAARGVKLLDGFMWPHHPRTAKLHELLRSGTLGELRHVTAAFTFPLQPLDGTDIRLRPECGGGSLLDVGCYPIYGIRWAMGQEPVRVSAFARKQFGVDVAMTGILEFANGATASFDCGFTATLRMWLEVAGSAASLCVTRMWLPEPEAAYIVERPGQPNEVHKLLVADQIQHMLDNMSLAVRDNRAVLPAPTEAVKTLRVLDALALAARSGKVVEVQKQ